MDFSICERDFFLISIWFGYFSVNIHSSIDIKISPIYRLHNKIHRE